MSIDTIQLRELIQEVYKKFGYMADDEVIDATLNQTIDVLKNNDPPAKDVIKEICLAKSCIAKSERACNYFYKKYWKKVRRCKEVHG